MDWFVFIKDNYIDGFYNDDDVREFVMLNKIDELDYTKITGNSYN
ncbi:hypothetical protein C671_1217 [[Clostridium] bifermentans ATCC 19299]|nr:XkdX family protein [Paraclostridium bifermentans]EQK47054.1 hypothetical protein C671_1217 [[Clostridium] bifermentans ATCC 19299] [Paraclostridium bifermentans ATCC 19299]